MVLLGDSIGCIEGQSSKKSHLRKSFTSKLGPQIPVQKFSFSEDFLVLPSPDIANYFLCVIPIRFVYTSTAALTTGYRHFKFTHMSLLLASDLLKGKDSINAPKELSTMSIPYYKIVGLSSNSYHLVLVGYFSPLPQ